MFSSQSVLAATLDKPRMRGWRQQRVVQQLVANGLAGIVLFNPVNIRYACDARNMQVYGLHNPCRYVFVAADSHVSLFEFRNCEHLAAGLPVNEVRPARAWYHMAAGSNAEASVQRWADEIADLARQHGNGHTIAFDRLDPAGADALAQRGIRAVDGLALMDAARAIKSADEIACMQDAVDACEEGLRRMQAALSPGISEQALWAVLAHANAELGGEWMETRLLSAGQRTNPWYNECGEHLIENGDLVSFDTDLVGRHGYAVDVSRSWLTGEGVAPDALRELYQHAHAQVQHNIGVLKPGLSFREITQAAYTLPERFVPRMNRAIAHGIGLCNEYPLIVNRQFEAGSYDGVLEAGMVLCVESYVGEPGGPAGVKLEEQVLVTEHGAQRLSSYPYEERLL